MAPSLSKDPVVQLFNWLCIATLVAMIVLIAMEVVLRYSIGWSWSSTDEVGGYLLVALTYLSLGVSLAKGGFHQLEIVQSRLSPRNANLLNLALLVVSLAFALVVVWQFVRLALRSMASEEISNALMIPLWIPRLPMLLGSAALVWVLVRLIIQTANAARTADQQGDLDGR